MRIDLLRVLSIEEQGYNMEAGDQKNNDGSKKEWDKMLISSFFVVSDKLYEENIKYINRDFLIKYHTLR